MAQKYKEGSPERVAQLMFQQAGNEDKQVIFITKTGRCFWEAGPARRIGEGEPQRFTRAEILSPVAPAAGNDDKDKDKDKELTAEKIDALKAEYETLAGKAPGHNWKPDTLSKKIKQLLKEASEKAETQANDIDQEIVDLTEDSLPKVTDLKKDTLAFMEKFGIEHTEEDTEQELCDKAKAWFEALEK